jgi:short-subunit dehydrogenase
MEASPRMFFQTAEAVVQTAIRANDQGRVVVVPGWHNKLAAFLLHYMPGPLVRSAIRAGSARYHLDP